MSKRARGERPVGGTAFLELAKGLADGMDRYAKRTTATDKTRICSIEPGGSSLSIMEKIVVT